MRILGIDIGSRAVKIAVFEESELVLHMIFSTSEFYHEFSIIKDRKVSIRFDQLSLGNIDRIIATGYGRNNINVQNSEVIVELKAHTYGAIWQTGLENFTLLDLGGQDSKVISVKNRKMADLILNDKCAASCGRFLENMASVLGITIQSMEGHFLDPVELSSTCAVFSETELIGKISEGYPIEELAAGVNHSLFRRIKPLIERFPEESLVVTGGVAHSPALIHFLKTESRFKEVIIPKDPQLNGAIGCCAYGLEKFQQS